MRRMGLSLSIAVLTFFVGLCSSGLFSRSEKTKTSSDVLTFVVPAPTYTVREEPRYKSMMWADGMTPQGHRFGATVFVSPDGIKLPGRLVYFDSPQRARQELEKALRAATAVIKREQLTTTEGAGEKVIATFPRKSDYGPIAMLWTNGSTFGYVQNPSLAVILDFASQ